MVLKRSGWTGIIVLFCIGMMVVGCAGLGKKVDPPKVNIIDIKVTEFRALETGFNTELRVINPNDFPLKIRGVQFDMRVNSKDFATGVSNQAVDIPALGSGVVSVEVFASVMKMASSVWDMVKGTESEGGGMKHIAYELKGKLYLSQAGSAKTSIPFKSKGELSFDR